MSVTWQDYKKMVTVTATIRLSNTSTMVLVSYH